eukprot:12844479-Alexandrium_andersonii.AAC.1
MSRSPGARAGNAHPVATGLRTAGPQSAGEPRASPRRRPTSFGPIRGRFTCTLREHHSVR